MIRVSEGDIEWREMEEGARGDNQEGERVAWNSKGRQGLRGVDTQGTRKGQ